MGELGKETSGSHEEEEEQGGERRFYDLQRSHRCFTLAIEQRAKQSIRQRRLAEQLGGRPGPDAACECVPIGVSTASEYTATTSVIAAV